MVLFKEGVEGDSNDYTNYLLFYEKILNSLFSIVQKFNVSYRWLSRNFLLPSNVSKRYDKANKKGALNGYFLWLTIGYRSDNDCCHSCEDVREAYRKKGWAISNPDMIDQNDPVSNHRGKKNLVLSGWGDESILSEDFINPYYIPFNFFGQIALLDHFDFN
ncbi:hypothetical protein LOK49_LG12G02847 [Camellia lanceoleosa]|uniref:Uncharacterized protein n=1 Tax=Camellia lanceoleosa TaxID=1840588 RepID=A0ACC0FSM1_9ERIC|nr:hypothetical protein LOK49_LG12G02847 [Camellia lanceoleosa]